MSSVRGVIVAKKRRCNCSAFAHEELGGAIREADIVIAAWVTEYVQRFVVETRRGGN